MPKVSVVMPAYNSAPFIGEAMESILRQTFTDFEFIIVNDGSTDGTEEAILSFKDKRIRYCRNESNIGNNLTRNRGFDLAASPYLCIADSDDRNHPERLAKQVAFLDAHPKIAAVGTRQLRFGAVPAKKTDRVFRNPDFIAASMTFRNVPFQPTMMLRRDAFSANRLSYDSAWENMGDYELWYRAMLAGLRFSNIPEALVEYRYSENQIRVRRAEDRERKLSKFLAIRLQALGLTPKEDELALLFEFLRKSRPYCRMEAEILLSLFDEMAQKQSFYDKTAFEAVLLWEKLRLAKWLGRTSLKEGTKLAAQSLLRTESKAKLLLAKERLL